MQHYTVDVDDDNDGDDNNEGDRERCGRGGVLVVW